MIESFVLIEEKFEKVYERYNQITGSVASEISKEFLICDDMRFEDRNGWCLITLLYGDNFAEDILLDLTEGKLVYCFSDDSQMDCEFLVINNNNVLRKKYIYSDTPELNEDEGALSCEIDKKFIYWNDIDYFANIVKQNPESLFV